MVATDTVVGIVGAVVLVGVLAGVFIYEYNNEPAPVDQVEDEGPSQFEMDYPTLAAREDLDGDGVPNDQDDDIDGDEIPNEEDLDVIVEFRESGVPLGAHAPPTTTAAPAFSSPQFVGSNLTTFYVHATYAATVPEQNTARMVVLGPDGNEVAEGKIIPPNNPRVTNPVKLAVELPGPLPVGNYTVRIEHTEPSNEVSVNFYWALTYVEPKEFEEEEQ